MTTEMFFTNEGNPKLAKSEYLYSPRHILVLSLVILTIIILSVIFFKKSQKTKRKVILILVSILLFFEISSRVVNLIINTNHSLESIMKIILPMHICSVMVWVFIVAVFVNKKWLYNFSVVGGLLATLAFLAYPAVGLDRVYMTFTQLYSTISHSIGFICAILLMVYKFTSFKFKDMWQMLLCFAVMFGWGALLDFVIFPGSNYMYLIKDPLEMTLSFPFHYLYGAMLLAYISIYYIVSAIVRKIIAKKTKKQLAK